jgi:deazaflavin-dependent oxidoreductase (nitroreductase family)
LTSVGAKSDLKRTNPLPYVEIDGEILVEGSFGGADRDPAWVHNLRANPLAAVEVGGDAFVVIASEVVGVDREVIFPRFVERSPILADLQKSAGRSIPLFVLRRRSP